MSANQQVVIVGAGPAGVRAAEILVGGGVRPTILDEGVLWGGQIYRQPLPGGAPTRSKRMIYGFEHAKADRLHTTMAKLLEQVNYHPETLAWNVDDKFLDTLHAGQLHRRPFTHLILASGATDRILPVPGWTLPGCFTLGGAQTALKAHGCAIGRRLVLSGSGPLLYLIAHQYASAGVDVAAVLDTSSWSQQLAAVPRLLNQPAVFAKGLFYLASLQRRGVRVERNVRLLAIDGHRSVESVKWTYRTRRSGLQGEVHRVDCDAIALGYGLCPETQLADVARCRFEFSERDRFWVPVTDEVGRTSVSGIYVAGDGAGIAGADAAELAGRRAGIAVLNDIGISASRSSSQTLNAINRKLDRVARFREGIERAFPMPEGDSNEWPDDLTVCRCEEISAGSLRECIRTGGVTEINRLKAITRVGMGRCQGRMCAPAASVLLSEELGKPLSEVGRLRAQPPIKPLPVCSQAEPTIHSGSQ